MVDTTLTVTAAGCTVSGGGLTATSSTASTTGAASADQESGGLYYFECTATTVGSNDWVGLANQAASLTAFNSTLKLIWLTSGSVQANGGGIGTAAAFSNGNLLCIAVNLTTGFWWGRVGAAGNWNNSASADPVAGIGGFPFSSLGPVAPFVQFNNNAHAVTFNFGGSAFTGTVPSGYTSGWPLAVTEMVASQVGAEGWVANSPNMQVSQAGVEGWVANTPAMQASQLGIEVWQTTATETQYTVTQLGIELWRTTANVVVPVLAKPWLRHLAAEVSEDLFWLTRRHNNPGGVSRKKVRPYLSINV